MPLCTGAGRKTAAPVVAAALLAAAATASTPVLAQGAAAPAPPPYTALRYDEDYRYLRDPARRTDIWDPVKYIPLGDAPQTYLGFGGELRERFEYYSAPDFGLNGQGANAYLLHRLLLYGDLHVGDDFRTFVQFGNFLAANKNNVSGVYADHLDLQQGFADIRLPVAPEAGIEPILRAGRQEMAFGSQKLISIRDAPNVPRTFDGVRLGDTIGNVRIDAFVTRPTLLKIGVFDDYPNHNEAFWGVYGTVSVPIVPGLSADLYYLGFDNGQARYVAGSGREHRQSIGTRLFGAAAGLDWDWEAVGQFGAFAGQNIRAWTVAANTGYTIGDIPWLPRVGLRANIASGDGNPSGSTLGTFNALFPKLGYFNQAALLYPANIVGIGPTLVVKPTADVTATVTWDFAWRATTRDAVWIEPFTPFPGTAGRGGRFIGNQPAIDVFWQIDRHWGFDASFVHFSVGNALSQAGGKDVDFAAVSLAYRF